MLDKKIIIITDIKYNLLLDLTHHLSSDLIFWSQLSLLVAAGFPCFILKSISMLVKHNLSFLGQNSYFMEKYYFSFPLKCRHTFWFGCFRMKWMISSTLCHLQAVNKGYWREPDNIAFKSSCPLCTCSDYMYYSSNGENDTAIYKQWKSLHNKLFL
jgi:hypothetical protein